MSTKIERTGKVAEYGGTPYLVVLATSPLPPTMVIECKGIVVVAKEDILHGDIAAAHHVYAVAPWMT